MTVKLATRYACSNRNNSAAGFSTFHSHGNGKPRSKTCTYCRGAFHVQTGLWGVFTWTGDGRYPETSALKTFTREQAAQAFVDAENERTEYQANMVVRWIFRDS